MYAKWKYGSMQYCNMQYGSIQTFWPLGTCFDLRALRHFEPKTYKSFELDQVFMHNCLC